MYNPRPIMNTPWKICNELLRLVSYPRMRLLFALNGIDWKSGWRFYGKPIIQKHRRSIMNFGKNLSLRSSTRSNPLGANHPVILATWLEGSRLEIGENFGMTGGALCAAEEIIIGNNVTIGANTVIADTDFHPLDAKQRRMESSKGKAKVIVINDDVFIGMNSIILKGVTIGCGSIIGAGSVVASDVASGEIVAGNPAKLIRKLVIQDLEQEGVQWKR